MNKELLNAFLKDLDKLTKKHKMEISGCGCCGSPLVSDVKPSNGGHYSIKDNFIDGEDFAEGLSWSN